MKQANNSDVVMTARQAAHLATLLGVEFLADDTDEAVVAKLTKAVEDRTENLKKMLSAWEKARKALISIANGEVVGSPDYASPMGEAHAIAACISDLKARLRLEER